MISTPILKQKKILKVENTYKHQGSFHLESGESLMNVEIRYTTYGELNPEKSNVIWIVHALTANSDPEEWWPEVVGQKGIVDTEKYFVVCASVLGGHYGSTNPLSINSKSGQPYFHEFPRLTNRDIVNGFDLLRKALGINRIFAIIGASIGGQQALEWTITKPELFERAVLLATNARHSPWGIAFNESQRMAISIDPTWSTNCHNAGLEGLKVARSIALLSYRNAKAYNSTQEEELDVIDSFKACSYQQYQGEKLTKRYNAFSYFLLSQAMDSHNVGRNRGGVKLALSNVKAKTYIVGIDSDLLFPLEEQKEINRWIVDSELFTLTSELGHDGFLTETNQLSDVFKQALT